MLSCLAAKELWFAFLFCRDFML